MSDAALRRILRDAEAEGGATAWARAAAATHRAAGEDPSGLRLAASAYDRAYGLAPDDETLALARRDVLDRLEVREYGLVFRYVPAGPLLMGSSDGDPDEQPVHEVRLDEFWITDVPVSWSRYCALMGWSPPREGGFPYHADGEDEPAVEVAPGLSVQVGLFSLNDATKIRRVYCEDRAHEVGAPELWERRDEWTFEQKPMVAVPFEHAEWLGARLTAEAASNEAYSLPSEAQWEKAARGGLLGRRYPWGDESPEGRCDFDHLDRPWILPSRTFPPNGYGLHAMSGSVSEWTTDDYDAEAYLRGPAPPAPSRAKVVRGGSWADCAEAVTVSFRGAFRSRYPEGLRETPTVGFRLVRTEAAATSSASPPAAR